MDLENGAPKGATKRKLSKNHRQRREERTYCDDVFFNLFGTRLRDYFRGTDFELKGITMVQMLLMIMMITVVMKMIVSIIHVIIIPISLLC